MKALSLLLLGVVVGWAVSGVDWTRDAVGQDAAPETIDRLVHREHTGKPDNSVDEIVPAPSTSAYGQPTPRLHFSNQPALVDRYQATAYGSPSGHGCYIVDTMTGRTWHVANGQPPQAVAEALGAQAAQPVMPAPTPSYTAPTLEPSPSTNEPSQQTPTEYRLEGDIPPE